MHERVERDWLKFWIWFACATPFGAFAGLRMFTRSSYLRSTSPVPLLLHVAVGALVAGLIGGVASGGRRDA